MDNQIADLKKRFENTLEDKISHLDRVIASHSEELELRLKERNMYRQDLELLRKKD